MSERNFSAGLREADQALAQVGLPAEVDQRIRRRLRERQSGSRPAARRRQRAAGLAVACAVLLLFFRPAWLRPGPIEQLGALTVLHRTADFRASVDPNQTVEIQSGGCTLVDQGSGETFATLGPARIRRESSGVRVVRGTVEVKVEKRPLHASPALVLVSHGAIRVMGTQFTIEQGVDSGRVSLHEGAIRFTSTEGEEVLLHPGESLDWPLGRSSPPAAPQISAPLAPPAREPHTHAAPSPTPEPNVEEILDHVAVLRSRGQYEEGVDALSTALKHKFGLATRERLSFELGAILTFQLADPKRACAHWLEHQRTYPSRRYDAEIEQATEHLKCPPTN